MAERKSVRMWAAVNERGKITYVFTKKPSTLYVGNGEHLERVELRRVPATRKKRKARK